MEGKKFQEKLRDWAINLGFRLPDGSIPNAEFFTFLAITPNRRQLWEAVMESVQPRQKVMEMRKQILVAKLQNKINYLKRDFKETEDRVDLWHKQNKLKVEIKEKRLEIERLEKSVMAKADDTIFQLDILAELEKQLSELQEKVLFLKLYKKPEEKFANDLLKELNNNVVESSKDVFLNFESAENVLLNSEECKQPPNTNHDCGLLNNIKNLCNSGMMEQQLWEDLIKCKKNLLEKFFIVLKEFDLSRKNFLSEKDAEIEKKKSQSIIELKQKITEKSMEVALSSTEGKLMDSKVQKLIEKIVQTPHGDASLSKATSFLSSDEMSESSCEEKENLKKCLNLLGLRKYIEYLRDEVKKVEDATKSKMKSKEGGETLQAAVKAFESTVCELMSTKAKENEARENIFRSHEKVQTCLRLIKEEEDDSRRTEAVREVAEKLCSTPEKRIQKFLDTPMDAFRTFEISGRMMFEWESASHRLKNYGGDLRSFCPAMLIPPVGDVQRILAEIERRKVVTAKLKKFKAEKERLAALEMGILSHLKDLKYDTGLCEKNFIQSKIVLGNICSRTENTFKEMDSIEQIIKFWLEQPFRLMIREKGLSEYKNQFN